MNRAATAIPEGEVRVLAVERCPSVSGKSKLTYHIGILGSEIQLKVHANSGGGFFSEEWVSLSAMVARMGPAAPFTSRVLNPLFTGKSANTPGFLMAVLKNEGLIRPSASKRRCWELGNVEAFRRQVEAMTGAPLNAKKKPSTGTGKTPAASSPAPTAKRPSKAAKSVPASKPRARK